MKRIFLMLILTGMSGLLKAQQDPQQAKTDSVCKLVVKFFNDKNAEGIYDLTGESFQKALTPDAFKTVCENNLFPLGKISESHFESRASGVSKYKTVFASMDLALFLGLDKADKIEDLLFKPYVDENGKKTGKVPTSNALITPLDLEVDHAVQPYITLKATTGLSIGILKDGKTYFYGYGEMATGDSRLPDEHTIFEIGSITKTFTAILLADAVNAGLVKLDDPINKYLPDSIPPLEFEGVAVTLKDLSNHTSGIPELPSNFRPVDGNNPYNDYTLNDLFSFYKHFRLTRKPGSQYEYSNLAVGTLGVILERVYKQRYPELVEETICKPLGMADTREFLQKNDSARFAKGYTEQGVYNPPWDFKALAAAGALRSTAGDLIKYARANLGTGPQSLEKDIQLTHAKTFTDGINTTALGWHYIKPGKDELLFHNGGTGGYRSYLAINLEKGFAVVILSNTAIGPEESGNSMMKWLETTP